MRDTRVRLLCLTLLDHPQYDLHLLSQMKEEPRGHDRASDDQVKTAVQLWFHHHDAQFYRGGFSKLGKWWGKFVDRYGDYVDKYL